MADPIVTIKTRRDEAADWSLANPVLSLGEIGLETDTLKAKFGDGFTAWDSLPYFIDPQDTGEIPDGVAAGDTLFWDGTAWKENSQLVVNDGASVQVPYLQLGRVGTSGSENFLVYDAGPGVLGFQIPSETEALRYVTFRCLDGEPIDIRPSNPGESLSLSTGGTRHLELAPGGEFGIGRDPITDVAMTIKGHGPFNDTLRLYSDDSASNQTRLVLQNANAAGTLFINTNNAGQASIINNQVSQSLGIEQKGNGYINFRTNDVYNMRFNGAGDLLMQATSVGAGAGIFLRGNLTDPYISVENSAGAVSGNWLHEFRQTGQSTIGTITQVGAPGTGVAYNVSSDYRLKTLLGPVVDAVSKVLQVPVHHGYFNADPADQHDLFLAHEVQAVFPRAVAGEKDGEQMQQLDRAALVPALWAAVQELAARVEALENA